jgi:SAM-dependent methyltransferase
MLDIPLNNRAYLKPLGYPGDYQVMLYYYADGYEGDTVFTRAMHKLHMEHPLAVGVRTRKDFIVDLIEREHRQMTADRGKAAEFRIVSLGCGPARETSDYIRRVKRWPGRMVWTLIDQEEKALSVAYRAAQSEVGAHGCACTLNLLNLSFVQMLSEGLPLREPGSQHFIYSTGLFDYVRESRAKTLLRGMYDLLAAGGFLTVGNAIAPNEHFWTPEFLGDWTILYRTKEEMQTLAALLPEEAQVEITVEPGGAYYFLTIRKPA